MKHDYLIFDLDGTLSDPKHGIARSINFALETHGFETREDQALYRFIGPPLDASFEILTESKDAQLIASLIAKYRERYSDIGYAENCLYKGIPEVLEELSRLQTIKLGVCTLKRIDFAEQILDMFSLRHHFNFVSGGDIGIRKWQQLETLLGQGVINHNSVMIGDRDVDITAAHKNNIHSVGVLWGYGSQTELSQHEPSHLFSNPRELVGLAA